jgi:hypothetical protein
MMGSASPSRRRIGETAKVIEAAAVNAGLVVMATRHAFIKITPGKPCTELSGNTRRQSFL